MIRWHSIDSIDLNVYLRRIRINECWWSKTRTLNERTISYCQIFQKMNIIQIAMLKKILKMKESYWLARKISTTLITSTMLQCWTWGALWMEKMIWSTLNFTNRNVQRLVGTQIIKSVTSHLWINCWEMMKWKARLRTSTPVSWMHLI